jgi:two-component system response regulator FixJ
MAYAGSVVYVVDDDEGIRSRLEALLGGAGLSVQSFESAKSFLAVFPQLAPGCVVTDVRMPEITGLELLRQVMISNPRTPVIVMTGMGDIRLAVDAMKGGAVDFLEKPFEDGPFLAAMYSALKSEKEGSKRNANIVAAQKKLASLSNRERQVLEELLAGNPSKIMAYNLGISARTIEKYRANLMDKMAAKSVADLVRVAMRAGVLDNSSSGGL